MTSTDTTAWTAVRLIHGTLAHIATLDADGTGMLRTGCGMTVPQGDTIADPRTDLYPLCHGCLDHAIDANQNRAANR